MGYRIYFVELDLRAKEDITKALEVEGDFELMWFCAPHEAERVDYEDLSVHKIVDYWEVRCDNGDFNLGDWIYRDLVKLHMLGVRGEVEIEGCDGFFKVVLAEKFISQFTGYRSYEELPFKRLPPTLESVKECGW